MPERRIIFVNRVYRPSQAATAQLATDLAEGLAQRGWSVQVIATGNQSEDLGGVTIHRTGQGAEHGGLISRSRNYGRFLRRARSEVTRLARPGDSVVAMTDPPLLGVALSRTALAQGARVIHWIQDIYPEIVAAHVGWGSGLALLPLRLRRDAAWRAAAGCVVLGETMARTLADRQIPSTRTTVIPNWAPRELERVALPAESDAQRKSWGMADKFVVAYSGNLGRVHEFRAIVDAAEILQAHPEIVFLFVGQGARLDEIRAMAKTRRLDNLHFRPAAPRETLAASLAAADIQLVTLKPAFAPLVYPSKLAGVLAAGKPVLFVGPPDGEIAGFLEREACGASVAPGDGARLAAKLIQWHGEPAMRAAAGQRARAAFEKHFTFAAALARWEEVLGRAGEPDA